MIRRRGKGGTFQLTIRTPARFLDVHPTAYYRASLRTDDRATAEAKAAELRKIFFARLAALKAGRDDEAATLEARLVELARAHGFEYQAAEDVAAEPLESVLRRVEVASRGVTADADALLGAAASDGLLISQAPDRFEELRAADNVGKSPDQMRKFRITPRRAAASLIAVAGDKALFALTRHDAAALRAHFAKRIAGGELSAYSANREIYTFRTMAREIAKLDFGRDFEVFDGIDFKEVKAKRRRRQVPFSSEWIRDRLLAPGALDGLNSEAADIFLAMINTGARPSELAALSAETIRLEAEIPHILILGEARQLKTPAAEREIPLAGVSLDAIARHPAGFPRYRDKTATWSAVVAKHLRSRELLETEEHRAYSARHSFSDRLTDADCPVSVREHLMGHAAAGTPYGKGPSLTTLARWVGLTAIG